MFVVSQKALQHLEVPTLSTSMQLLLLNGNPRCLLAVIETRE